MTSASEYQAKIDKSVVDMDRFRDIVNGDENTEVTTDNGPLPSIAKALGSYETIGAAVAAAASFADAAENAETLVLVWPGITNGAIAFTDAAGRSRASFLSDTDPLIVDLLDTTMKTEIWPSITPGGAAYMDGAGKIATVVTQNTPAFTDLKTFVENLASDVLRTELWPGITPGGTAFKDSAGQVYNILSPSDPKFTQLRSDVDDLLAGTAGSVNPPPAIGDLMHLLIHGQSLGTGTAGLPVVTTSPVPGGKRPSVGVRVADSGSEDPANWGTLAGLIETQNPVITNQGETIASGCVQRIGERLQAAFGAGLTDMNQSILVTSSSHGGTSIEELSSGLYFDRLMNTFEWAAAQAAAGSQSYNPLSMLWLQGQANSNDVADAYYAKLKAIWAAAQTRADAKRGYARPLVLTTFQPSEYANGANYDPLAAEAFLWVQEKNDNGLFSCPTYHLPPADTIGHLVASSYKQMGGHFGDVLFDFFWDSYKRPVLRPVVERLSARELMLVFNLRPGARLVLDTSAAELKNDVLVQHGVRLVPTNDTRYVDNVNNPVPPVSIDAEVRISGINKIYIKAVSDIPTNGEYEVRLGWYDCKYRNCTHFRDNAGDVLPAFDPSGINKRLHNWVPISRNLIP